MDDDLAHVMTASELDALVETCFRLKQRLVSFTAARYCEEIRRTSSDMRDLNQINSLIDDRIHAPSAPGRESVIDAFLAETKALTASERDLVVGWKNALIGVFEVKAREGRLLLARNLVDDLEFWLLVTSDAPAVLARLAPGVFVFSRVVPVGKLWMLSGIQSLMTAQEETVACRLSIQIAFSNPSLFFRNPLNLEKARHLTRETFDAFVARYHRTWLSGTPDAVRSEVDAFYASRMKGPIAGEPGQPSMGLRPAAFTLPEPLLRQTSISFFVHPSAGTVLFGHTERLIEAFDRPDRAGLSPYSDELRQFLSEAGVAGCRAIEGIGAWSPTRASAIFREFTGRRDFDWGRDGSSFLRSFTPELASDPGWPTELPFAERLTRVFTSAAESHTAKRSARFEKRSKRKRKR